MSNQLVVQSQSEMMDMAKLFVESKMFKDITAVGMAFVKIQAGKEIGIAPFASMSGIHIIQGKPTVGAGLMAGCVKGSGKYNYEIVKMDDSICSIDFYERRQTGNDKLLGNSTFTKEDAIKAGTQNMAKFPKNMLFARAMSNGVKWFTPDVFTMPVYTPEEMGDPNFTEDIQHEEINAKPAAPTTMLSQEAEPIQTPEEKINATTTLPELQATWTALMPDEQKQALAAKDAQKAKLQLASDTAATTTPSFDPSKL